MWANLDEYERSPGREVYKLSLESTYSSCSTQIGGLKINPRFNFVGDVREDRLFADNGLNYIIRSLPLYPVNASSQYYWNLYSTTYNFWRLECEKHGFNRARMVSLANMSLDLSNSLMYLIIFCIVQFGLCIILPSFVTFFTVLLQAYMFSISLTQNTEYSLTMMGVSNAQCTDHFGRSELGKYFKIMAQH